MPAEFQQALLGHFRSHGRILPWRETRDPYRVWVSEVMLQQTRVETVRGYYERWVQQFPDLNSLAAAPIDQVLKAWEGLGYYSRARNLHRSAQLLRERHQSALPTSVPALRDLPGIGEYTAGAIASIAHGQPEPAVDGNVTRVLCRLLDRPRLSGKQCREQAARLVPDQQPGEFNQAFMELGATICIPAKPRCSACPVSQFCRAFARGTTHLRPVRKKKPALPDRVFTVLVLRDPQGRVLMHQRPHQGLLGGLWEFPNRESVRPAAFLRQLLVNHRPRSRKIGTFVHTFSHFRAHYSAHLAETDLLPTPNGCHILPWSALADLAMSVPQRSIYRTVSFGSP